MYVITKSEQSWHIFTISSVLLVVTLFLFNYLDISTKNPSVGIAESQEYNEEYMHQNMIHGHHMYKDIWSYSTGRC